MGTGISLLRAPTLQAGAATERVCGIGDSLLINPLGTDARQLKLPSCLSPAKLLSTLSIKKCIWQMVCNDSDPTLGSF